MEWTKPVEVDTTVDVDKAKERVKKDSSATAAATDHLPATSNITVGKILLIKDEGGSAGSNNITVATNDSSTIDGSASIILDSDYASISVYYNGTEWSVY